MLQCLDRHLANRLPGGHLTGDETELGILVVGKADQGRDRRQRDAAGRADLIQSFVVVPDQQLVFAQPQQYGIELGRIEIGEMRAQLLRTPARRLGTGADFAQDHQPHQHFVVATAEQRDERVQRVACAHQRKQRRQVAELNAVAEEFV